MIETHAARMRLQRRRMRIEDAHDRGAISDSRRARKIREINAAVAALEDFEEHAHEYARFRTP